jgi:uncharacterized protein YqeY
MAAPTTLLDQVNNDIAEAMRAKDQPKLVPLRMLKSALTNREIEKGRALDDREMLQVVAQLVKQRRDSIDQFGKAGRQDLVDREAAEITVLETYLPPPVSGADLAKAVDEAIASTGAKSPKDMGAVMKAVMAALGGGNVDGKVVNELVRKRLAGG